MNGVKYIAQHYTCTGNTYYYRTQLLRGNGEPYWSTMRSITRQTYERAQRNGATCEMVNITKPLADVIQFAELARYRDVKRRVERGINETAHR